MSAGLVPGLVGIQAAQYKFTDNGKPGPAALALPWVQSPINIVPAQSVAKFTYNAAGQIQGISNSGTSPITQALCQLHTTPTLRNQIIVADLAATSSLAFGPQMTIIIGQSRTTLEHYSAQIAFGPGSPVGISNIQLSYSNATGTNISLAINGPFTGLTLPIRLIMAWSPGVPNGLRVDFWSGIIPGTTKFYPATPPSGAVFGDPVAAGHPLTSGDNTEMLLRVSPAGSFTFAFSAVMAHAYNGNPPVPYG